MQYHYVVGYDSDKKRWWVENDPTAYFPDGNVWDDKQCDETGYGWIYPDEDSPEAALDMKLYRVLYSLTHTWPIPQEVSQ